MGSRVRLQTFMALGVLIAGVCVAMAVSGCGGGSGTSNTATGQLKVALTDATGPYAQVVISIKEVLAVAKGQENQPTGSGLPVIANLDPSQVIDVLTLHFVQTILGEATVPAGDYSQLRLVLDANPSTGDPVNYVTLTSNPDVKLPLTTPSGQQSGLKVVGDFQVQAGQLNSIAIDFDPTKAIVNAGSSGKYLLKPTGIRIVQMSTVLPTYGSLSGSVEPADAWPSAVVSIFPQGSDTAVAVGSVSPDDGTFSAPLPPGTYTIKVTADGYTSYDSASVPESYDVTTGNDTAVDTITLDPVTSNNSGN